MQNCECLNSLSRIVITFAHGFIDSVSRRKCGTTSNSVGACVRWSVPPGQKNQKFIRKFSGSAVGIEKLFICIFIIIILSNGYEFVLLA